MSTHSHVDLEENVLSVHSPRPLPSVKNDARSQDAQSNRNTTPTKSNSASIRRQATSSHDNFQKEPEARKLSRQSTISPLKDEDYFTDIGNQSIKRRGDNTFEREEEDDVEEIDDSRVRHQIRNAGFGNVLAFASDEKLQALNRLSSFNHTPVINESVIQGKHLRREGKRYIEINKDELNDILSHKEKFEQERANTYFSNQMRSSRFDIRNENPFKLIRSISDKVTEEIIENICHEMVTTDIVNDLIQKELQS